MFLFNKVINKLCLNDFAGNSVVVFFNVENEDVFRYLIMKSSNLN